MDTDTTLITMQRSLRRPVSGWICASPGAARRLGLLLLGAAISSIGGMAQAQSPRNPAHPSAPSPYTAPAPPPLEAGGLRPPSSAPTPMTAGETETLRQLQRAEVEDAGRGLEFFWVDVEGGYEYLSLQAFRQDALLDGRVVQDSGSGFSLGAGAGVRLIFLTLGGRFRWARFSAWDLYTLDAEIGLHMPLGALEPSFTFAAGYAALGSASAAGAPGFDASQLDASGLNARLGAALDYYVNPLLSFGVRGSFEALVLWRSAVEQPASVAAELRDSYARDGSGIGFGVTTSAVVGLHF